jgi:hypothetical protein
VPFDAELQAMLRIRHNGNIRVMISGLNLRSLRGCDEPLRALVAS